MTDTVNNPLLQPADALPAFDTIQPEHVGPAIDQLLAAAEAALEAAVSDATPARYDALAATLDVPVERLMRAWSAVSHLQSVADTPALRAAHAESLPRIIDFSTRLGADARLFAKYKAVAASAEAAQLTPAQQQVLAHALRDFRLGGAELEGEERARYAAIQERSGQLSQQFGDHVMDATDGWTLVVPAARLAGVPADVVAAARERAVAAGVTEPDTCQLTLHAPCLIPLLQFADDRELRETVFRADQTRCSEFGPAERNNGPLMTELLQLRHEEARLLGFDTFADLALSPKMARSPAEVLGFIRDLAGRARPFAERELGELRAHAATLGIADLQAWDRAYVSEKLKQARYAFSSQEVKQYFAAPRVLQGLFGLIETLFGVGIREEAAPVWHDTVRFFGVWRAAAQPGDAAPQRVAGFYLDLFARPGKQGGAWMDDVRGRWRRPDGSQQWPVAHLVCNFAGPVGDQPSLLTHSDVLTLFHEFGHGLHHMLTEVDELAVAGISGVEHDAVELPSQFMENFCWEWQVLQRLTGHVETGEALPRDLYDRMVAARHFHSGLKLLRQTEFGLLDMRLHSEPALADQVEATRRAVNAELQPMAAPDFVRFPNSFSHLFDGGYAAGYYGYAWAEVLSSDAYGAFEEAGVFDPATGQRFREQILAVGGSRPALESFMAFRGREPRLDAMLRHQGLA